MYESRRGASVPAYQGWLNQRTLVIGLISRREVPPPPKSHTGSLGRSAPCSSLRAFQKSVQRQLRCGCKGLVTGNKGFLSPSLLVSLRKFQGFGSVPGMGQRPNICFLLEVPSHSLIPSLLTLLLPLFTMLPSVLSHSKLISASGPLP